MKKTLSILWIGCLVFMLNACAGQQGETGNNAQISAEANFMFNGARWGATWEKIQQETGMQGGYVRQDDPSRVTVENAEYLGFPVKAVLVFDPNPESETYGLNTVKVQFHEEDKQSLLAALETVYGELQDTFLENNGYPSGKKDGWTSEETLESVLSPEENRLVREKIRQTKADTYQTEDAEQAESMLESYVDMRMRSPLKILYFQDQENCLQFSGATEVYAQHIQNN